MTLSIIMATRLQQCSVVLKTIVQILSHGRTSSPTRTTSRPNPLPVPQALAHRSLPPTTVTLLLLRLDTLPQHALTCQQLRSLPAPKLFGQVGRSGLQPLTRTTALRNRDLSLSFEVPRHLPHAYGMAHEVAQTRIALVAHWCAHQAPLQPTAFQTNWSTLG